MTTLKKGKKKHRKCPVCRMKFTPSKNQCSRCQNNRTNFGGKMFDVLKRDGYKCVRCGMTNRKHKILWGVQITIDHIDGNGFFTKKKNNSMNNLQTLCLRCHSSKDVRKQVKAMKSEIIKLRNALGRCKCQ